MIKRIAAIGDIHGTYEELEELYNKLCWLSLDEIWSLGDIVDRGPHSGKAVEFCRTHNIKGVMGNHDQSIINHFDRLEKGGDLPRNQDKLKTLQEITKEDVEYLKTLPPLHIIDDLNLILVHAGVWPNIPLYAQPLNTCRVQMIHPDQPMKCRWWGKESHLGPGKQSEEDSRKLGWKRWYEAYDYEQDIIFGHSTWYQPFIYQAFPDKGKCIGIDTGSSFGGCLTACIYNEDKTFAFMSIKNKKVYYKSTTRSFWES